MGTKRYIRSTDWAKEEYVELVQFQAPFFVGFYWDCSRVIRSTSSTDWAKEEYEQFDQSQTAVLYILMQSRLV